MLHLTYTVANERLPCKRMIVPHAPQVSPISVFIWWTGERIVVGILTFKALEK